MLVDSHCHLDFEDFEAEGVPAIVNRAREAGVGQMLTICCRVTEFESHILKTVEQSEFLDCTVGTHPHQADEEPELAYLASDLVEYSKHPRVVGIGETGLDYYYDNAPRDIQKKNLEKHIEACLETDLPIIIHNRMSDDDMADILKNAGEGRLRGVLHCFSSGADLAKTALDLGFYISMSGIVTFKKAEDLRDIVKDIVPLDRLLVETDSPYLAPVPKRGKTNEPSYVVHTAKLLSELKGVSETELANITTENYFKLFTKSQRRALDT
jgi:TatD DNase family protein|tara:strand:- start:28 stop:831 length:804 start_codon:yes stop_codon:yes gene_type:complete